MEKERYFAADQVNGYGFKKLTRDCNWQWHVADTPQPFKRKHKKNSGSLLTGRKHIKIVRPGDGCLNWEKNPGDLARKQKKYIIVWIFCLFNVILL